MKRYLTVFLSMFIFLGINQVGFAETVVDSEIQAIINSTTEQFNNDASNFTQVKRDNAQYNIQLIEDNYIENNIEEYEQELSDITRSPQSISAAYDENAAKLRTGNVIEYILNRNEGMSVYEIGVIFNLSNYARDAAIIDYPNSDYSSVMARDALRHFSWNFLSTRELNNVYKVRTATINHEWGFILINPAMDYYNFRYNQLKNQGYTDIGAANTALQDTYNYIPKLKKDFVMHCKSSYGIFKKLFPVSSIMDLHNNCYGRAYAVNYPSMTYSQAFYTAKPKGELILSETKVTDTQYSYVWRSQWYTY